MRWRGGVVATWVLSAVVAAVEPRWEPRLAVDQLGYLPQEVKICVIAAPPDDHATRAGPRLVVRRCADGREVFAGPSLPWQDGAVDPASGDAGWWFDFSAVQEPGRYEIVDPVRQLRSARFRIGDDAYDGVLRAACRMFFYNRANAAKQPPAADRRWSDAAGHLGAGQDGEARAVWARDDPSLARDCRGGWYDAGDQNKYVTFLSEAVHSLLTSWRHHPALWRRIDLGIPESGDAVPDLVDEVVVGLRFLERMQDADGGVFIKVGCLDHHDASPPSADRRPRFYGPKATSATIATAGMFAHAAWALADVPALADDCRRWRQRAERAWDWYQARRNRRDVDADTQAIKSGDADRTLAEQDGESTAAAVLLFALTGEERYHQRVREDLRCLQPFHDVRWGMWRNLEGSALSAYARLPGADPALVEVIRSKRQHELATADIYRWDERCAGLYRSPLPVPCWGSNRTLCDLGQTILEPVRDGLAPGLADGLRQRALGILHYLHGTNPQSMAYLTNLRDLGVERSANRIFHAWFAPGGRWSDAAAGIGPAPGFLVGGPNPDPGHPLRIRGGSGLVDQQPWMKAYSDDNQGMGIWTITEPAIYYQAAYIELLAECID